MSGRIFIDTNILVYAYTIGDMEKHEVAKRIFQTSSSCFVISTQVLSEVYVTLAKYGIEHDKIAATIFEIKTLCEVKPVTSETVNRALEIKARYRYSYWDSLILSSAFENTCSLLYSEDMDDGQIIENTLIIANPLK